MSNSKNKSYKSLEYNSQITTSPTWYNSYSFNNKFTYDINNKL